MCDLLVMALVKIQTRFGHKSSLKYQRIMNTSWSHLILNQGQPVTLY